MQEFMDRYEEQSENNFENYIRFIFEAFYSHKEDLPLIHKAGYSWLLLPLITERFHFDKYAKSAPLEKQYQISYIIGGIYNNLLYWFSRGMKETPSRMQEIALTYRPEGSFTILNAAL